MQTLTSDVASAFSVVYSVVVLPEPVGPVTRMMPCGRLGQLVPARRVVGREAQLGQRLDHHFRVEDAHHQLFAEGGRQGRQAQLDFLAAGVRVLMRPSCGRRFSMTSMRPSSLMRAVIAIITTAGTW